MLVVRALFGLSVYVYFLAILLAYTAALLPSKDWVPEAVRGFVPYHLDSAEKADDAVVVDILLILAFGIPHSIFARTAWKKRVNLGEWERPLYNLQATLLLHLLLAQWRTIDGDNVWDVSDTSAAPWLVGVYMFGFLWLVSATLALDHFELFGLSQSFGFDINKAIGLGQGEGVSNRAHYTIVAHPIMFGFLIMFWCTPLMSRARLLFAIVNTLYVWVAVKCFEEPQLAESLGEEYEEYLASVPSFCPFSPFSMGLRKRGRGGALLESDEEME